ncbi:B12-binding domain-containing radical SAM protein [Candidatus Fermentibacteria bacterium]|nr:B12-binding domain-containing radical SAM protein [Candidatus Fermentibacteria bacterium]
MRVCLVYPSYGSGRRSRYFPFGLAYVAASLRDAGHEVFVVDMEGNDLDPDRAVEAVCSLRPDMVGFGGMVTRFRFVREMGRELRKRLPGAFLIAGNSGATTIPGIYIESCGLDAVVIGEGEKTSCELASALESGAEWRHIPGLAFPDGVGIGRSPAREPVGDLDTIPWPAWDLFPVERYVNSFDHRQKLVRHLEVVASRGCPFDCVYCYRIYGRRVRRRSPASIVAEVEELVRRFDIRYTGFPDDLFTSDRGFVMEFCRLFRERLPGLGWSCLGRVNTVDAEMLSEMRNAGCDWISYGIESGSDAMLRAMHRGVTAEQCLNAILMTRKAGIHPDGSFMIGMYGETAETVKETVVFCRKADLTAPMLFVTPYPGTAIFDRAVSEGRIPSVEDLVSRMNAADDLLVNLTDLPDGELVALRNRAQRRIGLGYLARRPFTRIPRMLYRRFLLRGWKGVARDFLGLMGISGGRRGCRKRA